MKFLRSCLCLVQASCFHMYEDLTVDLPHFTAKAWKPTQRKWIGLKSQQLAFHLLTSPKEAEPPLCTVQSPVVRTSGGFQSLIPFSSSSVSFVNRKHNQWNEGQQSITVMQRQLRATLHARTHARTHTHPQSMEWLLFCLVDFFNFLCVPQVRIGKLGEGNPGSLFSIHISLFSPLWRFLALQLSLQPRVSEWVCEFVSHSLPSSQLNRIAHIARMFVCFLSSHSFAQEDTAAKEKSSFPLWSFFMFCAGRKHHKVCIKLDQWKPHHHHCWCWDALRPYYAEIKLRSSSYLQIWCLKY